MSAMGRGSPARSATAGREIVVSRGLDAPRELGGEAVGGGGGRGGARARGGGPRARPGAGDRGIVISRVIDAPRELVFEAFTEVRHLSRWWGPDGFTTTTRAFEFRVGGEWDFVMHGPDGTDYQEWISWTEIQPT